MEVLICAGEITEAIMEQANIQGMGEVEFSQCDYIGDVEESIRCGLDFDRVIVFEQAVEPYGGLSVEETIRNFVYSADELKSSMIYVFVCRNKDIATILLEESMDAEGRRVVILLPENVPLGVAEVMEYAKKSIDEFDDFVLTINQIGEDRKDKNIQYSVAHNNDDGMNIDDRMALRGSLEVNCDEIEILPDEDEIEVVHNDGIDIANFDDLDTVSTSADYELLETEEIGTEELDVEDIKFDEIEFNSVEVNQNVSTEDTEDLRFDPTDIDEIDVEEPVDEVGFNSQDIFSDDTELADMLHKEKEEQEQVKVEIEKEEPEVQSEPEQAIIEDMFDYKEEKEEPEEPEEQEQREPERKVPEPKVERPVTREPKTVEKKQKRNSRQDNSLMDELLRIISTFTNRGNSLVVTGVPSSGTSTVVFNLANLMADLGCNVLIVDMDVDGRTQSYMNKDSYDAVNSLTPDGCSLKSALRSANNLGSCVHIIKPGLHLVTTSLGSDKVDIEKDVQGARINRFASDVRNHYNFIIYDIPFNSGVTTFRDVTYTTDNIVLCCEKTNRGVMRTMLEMCNIDSEEAMENMFCRSQICFTKSGLSEKIMGYKPRTNIDILKRVDKEIRSLLGVEPEYLFEDIRVCGDLAYDSRYEQLWFTPKNIIDFEDMKLEYMKLMVSILTKGVRN